ncbi:isochorismatase [Sorangium cellulosum]|uniref:Isochorismatase n=1 Tax=Sorangium cellulosum TaxID=56 RepID=A0A2L0FCB7_SORCE|nr:isochorismatase family protein [Sorangium cellulosum]AUX49079.1 isochorismatase [Sorangium cellulosum]
MPTPMQRLEPAATAVVVVDVQEKLAAAMPAPQMEALTRAATLLIEAARRLGAPVLATEQYPAGLGPTVRPIADRLAQAGAPVLSKMEFSACDAAEFERAWAKLAPRAAIVVGMEAHVCVYQTARDLAARGVLVHVPLDGVASRRDDHRLAGLDLCRAAGATLTTAETVVFDWLRVAGTDDFKHLARLIR